MRRTTSPLSTFVIGTITATIALLGLTVPAHAEFEGGLRSFGVSAGFGNGVALAGKAELGAFSDNLALTGAARYRHETFDFGRFFLADAHSYSINWFSFEPAVMYRFPLDSSWVPFVEGGLGLNFGSVSTPIGTSGVGGLGIGLVAGVGADYMLDGPVWFGGHAGHYSTGFEVGVRLTMPIDR